LAQRVSNLSDVDTFGNSALIAAASRGHHETVQVLIDAGAVARNLSDGFFAMLQAVSVESSEKLEGCMLSAQLLINAGVNPNDTDEKGTRAVQVACKRGNVPMLDMLISNGAQVDLLDKKGRGLLTYAVAQNSLPMVQSLVDQGLDLNQRINAEKNQTILMYATNKGFAEIADFLKVRGADQEILDYKGRNASDYAGVTKVSATALDQENKKARVGEGK
jgi:ankyrin repeat protein